MTAKPFFIPLVWEAQILVGSPEVSGDELTKRMPHFYPEGATGSLWQREHDRANT